MSEYMNYDVASAAYDVTRISVGIEIILGCFARRATPLSEMVVLDAGCGTGNDTQAIWPHVSRVDACDISEGMLETAAKKLQTPISDNRISLRKGSIDELPFDDAVFDGAIVNQVLHHLPESPTDGFPAFRKVLEELARVLKPDGVLVVGTCSREQVIRGFWYNRLIPSSVLDRIAERYVPLGHVEEMFAGTGFTYAGRWVPVDAIQQGIAYFNPRGPLDSGWRAGDSTWALLDDAQLKEVVGELNALDSAGLCDDFVRDNDRDRQLIGQVTFLCATRTSQTTSDEPAH